MPAKTNPSATAKAPKKLIPRIAPKMPAPGSPPANAAPPSDAAVKNAAAKAVPAQAAATKGAAGKTDSRPARSTKAAPEKTESARADGASGPRRAAVPDETLARRKKILADALVQAQKIDYEAAPAEARPLKPGKKAKVGRNGKADKPEKMASTAKPAKAGKSRLVRDSYAMPEAEYACIAALKKRMAGLDAPVKKNELLRAGIALLTVLDDAGLKAAMARVERIKTGRPTKK